MILKGNQRGGGQQLAAHLLNSFESWTPRPFSAVGLYSTAVRRVTAFLPEPLFMRLGRAVTIPGAKSIQLM